MSFVKADTTELRVAAHRTNTVKEGSVETLKATDLAIAQSSDGWAEQGRKGLESFIEELAIRRSALSDSLSELEQLLVYSANSFDVQEDTSQQRFTTIAASVEPSSGPTLLKW
ncbi:MAG: hypothetical protein ACRCSF_08710 [Mycobacteriaceae bacterium]